MGFLFFYFFKTKATRASCSRIWVPSLMGSLNVVRLLDWKPFGAKPQIQEDLVANHWQSQCVDSETRALGGSST